MDNNQKSNVGGKGVISGLKWIGALCRDLKFDSIRGVVIRDGAMVRGVRFRMIYTGKPRPRGSSANHDKLDGDDVLKNALHDIQQDTASREGEWEIQFKVHKGIPVSWGIEDIGSSSMSRNK